MWVCVLDAPIVHVDISPQLIEEDCDRVTAVCRSDANPEVDSFRWYLGHQMIENEESNNLILTGKSVSPQFHVKQTANHKRGVLFLSLKIPQHLFIYYKNSKKYIIKAKQCFKFDGIFQFIWKAIFNQTFFVLLQNQIWNSFVELENFFIKDA